MKIHRLAKYFPILEGEEFDALVQDIKEHGQLEPIITVGGEILDGVNRYKVCEQLGIEPIQEEYRGDDPLSYVVSVNIRRRHLSESQRAMLATEMEPEIKKRNKGQPGILENLQNMNKSVSTETHFAGPPGRVTTELGGIFGVSRGSVARAKRIKEQAPERVDDIIKGKATVYGVDSQLRQTRAEAQATERKEKEEVKQVREHPKYVKEYLDVVRMYIDALKLAIAGSKRIPLAPETKQFIKTKHEQIRGLMNELEGNNNEY